MCHNKKKATYCSVNVLRGNFFYLNQSPIMFSISIAHWSQLFQNIPLVLAPRYSPWINNRNITWACLWILIFFPTSLDYSKQDRAQDSVFLKSVWIFLMHLKAWDWPFITIWYSVLCISPRDRRHLNSFLHLLNQYVLIVPWAIMMHLELKKPTSSL